MYDNVSGSRPHTHGDRLVKSPAANSNGRLASRLPGSLPLRLRLANCEATFCVWYKMSSRPGVVMPRDDGVVAFADVSIALLLCLFQCWRRGWNWGRASPRKAKQECPDAAISKSGCILGLTIILLLFHNQKELTSFVLCNIAQLSGMCWSRRLHCVVNSHRHRLVDSVHAA